MFKFNQRKQKKQLKALKLLVGLGLVIWAVNEAIVGNAGKPVFLLVFLFGISVTSIVLGRSCWLQDLKNKEKNKLFQWKVELMYLSSYFIFGALGWYLSILVDTNI